MSGYGQTLHLQDPQVPEEVRIAVCTDAGSQLPCSVHARTQEQRKGAFCCLQDRPEVPLHRSVAHQLCLS